MTRDDVLRSAHELPLVRANLLDHLRKPAGRLTVRMVPDIDETVQLLHPVTAQRGAFRYFCSIQFDAKFRKDITIWLSDRYGHYSLFSQHLDLPLEQLYGMFTQSPLPLNDQP